MTKQRVGIFGGTFSPPHLGHVKAAMEFINDVSLDKLFVIPTFIPPHKIASKSISPRQRIEMCRLAFSDVEKAEISDIEISRGGKSFTYLTLKELASDNRELFLLVGTDMFLTLAEWKNPEIIFSLCTVCYIRREDDERLSKKISEMKNYYESHFKARIIEISSEVIEISSTEIREKLASDDKPEEFLPEQVLEYIRKRGLYS